MPATLDFSHLLVDAFFGVLVLCGGFLLGWWLRRVVLAPLSKPNGEVVRSSVSRMGDVTRGIRVQMGRHRQEMADLLNRMAGEGSGDREAVSSGLRQLIESNEKLQRELDQAETRLNQQARTIEDYAARVRIDTLTQVMNRGTFDEELSRRMAEWHRRARPFCVLMLDVDQFKEINDQHGHQAGDEVLQLVAQVLRSTMREMDLVARFGGDEFALLLPDTTLVEATLAADRLRRRVEGLRVPIDDQSLSVTISLGVAEVAPADHEEAVVRRADEALYAAKETGRNRTCYHDGTQTASMPLGGGAGVFSDSAGTVFLSESLPRALHPGLELMLADVACRIAESERTGGTFSLAQFQLEALPGAKNPLETGRNANELASIGQQIQSTLREMDKCVLIGNQQFAAILPVASESAAAHVVRRAIAQLSLPDSPLPHGMAIRASRATYQPGDDAKSLFQRLLAPFEQDSAEGISLSSHPLVSSEPRR